MVHAITVAGRRATLTQVDVTLAGSIYDYQADVSPTSDECNATRLNAMRCRFAEAANVSVAHVNVAITGGSITLRFTVLSDALCTQPYRHTLRQYVRCASS